MKFSKAFSLALGATAIIATSGAFAQRDPELPKATPEVTTPKARAEVKAETAQAKKQGELSQNSSANPTGPQAEAGPKKSRAEVKAETASAKQANGGALKTPKE
jgi:hypothetical protein